MRRICRGPRWTCRNRIAHDPESTAATELEGDLTDGVQAAIHKAVVDGKPINLKDDIRFRVTHGHQSASLRHGPLDRASQEEERAQQEGERYARGNDPPPCKADGAVGKGLV